MKVKKCSLPNFRKRFATQTDCINYLVETKWASGYQCSKCHHTDYKKGRAYGFRRCTSCGYDESPTANTIYHSIKLSLPLAFEMVYRISVNKKGISSLSLSREYDINYKTAYNFKRKVQQSMKSSEQHPLIGLVHVDEFMYGGTEAGCQGRSSASNKLKIGIAVEVIKDKKNKKETMGRAYAIPIDDFSADELRKIFDTHISKDAKVETDKWKGYIPIKEDFDIAQKLSEGGKNFPAIHNLIMNIKSWIRCIHHTVSHHHIKKYLDEFFFRYNRRSFIADMPIYAIEAMMNHKPMPVKLTKGGFYG